jgi:hypothetical protein
MHSRSFNWNEFGGQPRSVALSKTHLFEAKSTSQILPVVI